MSSICPTILAAEPHEYREQIERVQGFAERVQIDLMDGEFAPSRSINPIQIWWPDSMIADIHMMFKRPLEHIETLVSARPNLVIVHAEAEGDLLGMMKHLQECGIKAGICSLPDTGVESVQELVVAADHVLLFSGELGYFGGKARMEILDKVQQIRELNSGVEIGWDGGANEGNVEQLARGGVDVINVGSAIQKSADPKASYDRLKEIIANA